MGEPEEVAMQQKCPEIGQVAAMNKAELLAVWPEVFPSPAPRTASPEFLRMALAWQLQANKYGADTGKLHRRLRQLAEAVAEGKTPRLLSTSPEAKLGTTIVRTWRGKVYPVTVIKDGFVFDGVTYKSLSEIARKITGTRWNGPSFFGLRTGKPKKAAGGGRGK